MSVDQSVLISAHPKHETIRGTRVAAWVLSMGLIMSACGGKTDKASQDTGKKADEIAEAESKKEAKEEAEAQATRDYCKRIIEKNYGGSEFVLNSRGSWEDILKCNPNAHGHITIPEAKTPPVEPPKAKPAAAEKPGFFERNPNTARNGGLGLLGALGLGLAFLATAGPRRRRRLAQANAAQGAQATLNRLP